MNFLARIAVIVLVAVSSALAQTTAPAGPTIRECLVIGPLGRAGRGITVVDPIEAMIVAGTFKPPKAGDVIAGAGGNEQAWRAIESKEGVYTDRALGGGWACVTVDSPDDRIVLLAASGHAMAYVNGEPRAGDVYETGTLRLPIQLKHGENHLVFAGGRGRLRVELVEPKSPLSIETSDVTRPDFVRGAKARLPMAAVVVNATTQPIIAIADDSEKRPQPIPAMSARKVVQFIDYAGDDRTKLDVTFAVSTANASHRASADFSIDVVDPTAPRKVTFLSTIDGSTQYYSVVPSNPPPVDGERKALVLSLHGAGVEATSQAGAYSSKSWAHIVCPTNRRPFGFDWEEWGRLDALEVLAHAQQDLKTDPTRVYLTGHSMGGHGTWHIGSIYPDRFAAIGPSAGWLSFATYARGATSAPSTMPTTRPVDTADILRRAGAASDTPALMPNLASTGVYILHGDADDNVPVAQARQAAKILSDFHKDFHAHEQPGAGHWWDANEEPGADCVDWRPMFDLFAHRRLPDVSEVRDIDFRTVSPSISPRCAWLIVDQQHRPMRMSRVTLHLDPNKGHIIGTTENVARLQLDLRHIHIHSADAIIDIDGSSVKVPAREIAWLAHDGTTWRQIEPPDGKAKSAQRGGPFRLAFDKRMVFVYGTRGTPEETAANFTKARYDAEVWLYRGNGSVDVVPDTDDLWKHNSTKPDRNIILYGNADTNAAWAELLGDSPIQVKRGGVRIGEREIAGDDLACVFLRPHPKHPAVLVGAISGTGAAGMRLTNRLPIFVSGTGLPDWIVMGSDVLSRGASAIHGAGFFDNNWKIIDTDSAWNER